METKKRNPLVATTLSLLSAGLGQIYNGQIAKAIVLALIYLLFPLLSLKLKLHYSFYGLIMITTVTVLIKFFIMAEAFITARKTREIQLLRYNKWYFYLLFIITAITISNMTLSQSFGLKNYTHPSSAMGETITPEDRIMVDNNYYRFLQPQRGDVVTYKFPFDTRKKYIKRIVGIEGDRVEIKNSEILINDQRLNDKFNQLSSNLATMDKYSFGPVIVPQGKFFVMGDNPASSDDSRNYGPVARELIEGKVLYIYWSKDKDRIGRTIK